MTVRIIVECNVCHSRYVFKCQCDHVMNNGEMPIRIGCKNCGNLIKGSISRTDIHLDTGLQITLTELMEQYPMVGISTELPICKDCYFTNNIINNYLVLGGHFKSLSNYSKRISLLVNGMNETIDGLNTLHRIYENGNIQVFSQFAEKKFGKPFDEVISSKSEMRIGLINLLVKTFQVICTNEYYANFTQPYIVELDKGLETMSSIEATDLKNTISAYMDFESELDKSISLLMKFLDGLQAIYPVILLLEEGDFKREYKGDLYLSTTDYDDIKNWFAEMFELLSRWSMLLIGLENHSIRKRYDLMPDSGKFVDFCKKTNGQKSAYIRDNCWLNGYYLKTLDNKIRNGINHVKTTYDTNKQIITYFPNINKISEKHEIALVDFSFIILQQAIKLLESLYLAKKILQKR